MSNKPLETAIYECNYNEACAIIAHESFDPTCTFMYDDEDDSYNCNENLLIWACKYEVKEIANALLEAGHHKHYTSSYHSGYNALMWALVANYETVVYMILTGQNSYKNQSDACRLKIKRYMSKVFGSAGAYNWHFIEYIKSKIGEITTDLNQIIYDSDMASDKQ